MAIFELPYLTFSLMWYIIDIYLLYNTPLLLHLGGGDDEV